MSIKHSDSDSNLQSDWQLNAGEADLFVTIQTVGLHIFTIYSVNSISLLLKKITPKLNWHRENTRYIF